MERTRLVMNTLRLPLTQFSGVDLTNVQAIVFKLD